MTTRLQVVPSFVWTYILLTSFLMRIIDLIGLTYLVAHCCLFLAIGPISCYFPSMYCVRFGLMIKVPSSPPPIIPCICLVYVPAAHLSIKSVKAWLCLSHGRSSSDSQDGRRPNCSDVLVRLKYGVQSPPGIPQVILPLILLFLSGSAPWRPMVLPVIARLLRTFAPVFLDTRVSD